MAGEKENPISSKFTPRELEVLLKAHLCFKTADNKNKPSLDVEKLNEMCGYTHKRAGYNCYYMAMRKVRELWEPDGAPGEGDEAGNDKAGEDEIKADKALVTPKKATPRKRAAGKKLTISTADVKDEDTDNEAVDGLTPLGTPGSGKRKAGNADMENALPETPTKKKRTPRQPKAPELDENGNPVPKPKRGRVKKDPETPGGDRDAASMPATPATPATPAAAGAKKNAATGGRKKKADVAVATTTDVMEDVSNTPGVSSPVALDSPPFLQSYSSDGGAVYENANDAIAAIRGVASQATAALEKISVSNEGAPEDDAEESKDAFPDHLMF